MKVAFVSTAVLAVTVASAQNLTSLGSSVLGLLSTSCQSAVFGLVSNSSAGSISQCLNLPGLVQVVTANSSIIPPVNAYLNTTCGLAPCSNATLTNLAATVISGCSTDLAKYNVTNTTVYNIVSQYSLAREIACLKTVAPRNLTNASIPVSQLQTGNSTFCVASLLDDITAYTGVNLTVPTIIQQASNLSGFNSSVLAKIPPTALCSDCVFAAVSLVEQNYPQIANLSLGSNTTVKSYFNQTCPAGNLTLSTNGTLPATIVVSLNGSTYPFNVTAGNQTYPAANTTASLNSSSAANTTTTQVSARSVRIVRDVTRL